MSLSQATLVQRIRWEQKDFPWETTGSAASSSSVVSVADGTDWGEGELGEFQDDGEIFYVKSISTNDLTCSRGYYGTTAATHASGRIVKRPRHFYYEIVNAISSVIQGQLMWPKVYKKVADSITPSPADTVWYDLAADALDLIDVRQLYGTSDTKEYRYGLRHDSHKVVLRRNMTTSLATSGVGVSFPGGFIHPTNTVNIDYAARITDTVATNSYSDLTDGDALVEAVIYGAVAHLEGGLENSKPRKPRQDRETLRGAALYTQKFNDALNRAQADLRASMPLMRSHG